MSLAAVVLLLAAAPQGGGAFAVREVAGAAGSPPRQVVAADRRRIDCLTALQDLSAAVGWNLHFETNPLQNDLRFQSVDLNLADQDPRMVAQLIAVAAGADVVFDAGAPDQGLRPTLHVVRTPDPATESGRQRLRAIASQWYRSFLHDELQHEPLVVGEAVQVRMNLGQLLLDSGDLDGAIAFFTAVYDARPNDQVAAAMVRIAQCQLDLGNGETDRAARSQAYAKAEEWARRLLERLPRAPEVTQATVLLGRALLGQAEVAADAATAQQRAEQCQSELTARAIHLVASVEMLDVWLLAGEAQLRLGQPERTLETMLTLRESPYFADLSPRQFLDYHFLLGYGANGTGKPDLAMRALEWFLIHAEHDPRRGAAHVMLAEAYLAQKRLLQARAASVEARERHLGALSSAWRERALKVWARTALALGEKESAFLELEQLVLRGEEPELSLFLADEMLADHQWQRAISVLRPLMGSDSPVGDRARFKTIVALYEQSVATQHLEDFPSQAVAIAPRIKDPALRSRSATVIGDAYTRLGKLEHAADAYRGILR